MFIVVLRMVNLGEDETFDPESPEASLRHELCQIISGLSHACQLTNTLAFFFQVHLPFKLHHRYASLTAAHRTNT